MAHSTKSAPQRARLVARRHCSGHTQAAFARRHGLHPRTFWVWVREERAPLDAGRLEIALPTGECASASERTARPRGWRRSWPGSARRADGPGTGGHYGRSVGEDLKPGPRGIRIEGGVTPKQVLARNV